MKRIIRKTIAAFLAVLMAALLPVQVFADTPEYISEIKVFEGSYEQAESEGYTLLKDGSAPIDLNANAGGGLGSKGEKAVYLGYKTTSDSRNAITDLALMNMKGGYSVQEYEALMETQMSSQILPFISRFLVAVMEYRENYASDNNENQARAKYSHDILNKMTDDDTGIPLGDLFLNKTKEELGNDAYDALTPEQKKEHAVLSTIIAQADGKATILMETLLLRASDTNSSSWIDRFKDISYDDLIDETGLTPTDAEKKLAKLYDDDANAILYLWDSFGEQIKNADADLADLDNFEPSDADATGEKMDKLKNNETEENLINVAEDIVDDFANTFDAIEKNGNVAVTEYLKSEPYGDGTLYDFFTQDSTEIADDITVLYPLVASLSNGQRACLEFTSLKELVMLGATNQLGYQNEYLDVFEGGSIYEGVDRGIYEKGGVALTNDALRKDALSKQSDSSNSVISWYNYALLALTGISVIGFATSVAMAVNFTKKASAAQKVLDTTFKVGTKEYIAYVNELKAPYQKLIDNNVVSENFIRSNFVNTNLQLNQEIQETSVKIYSSRAALCKYLSVGFAVAAVILAGVVTYLSYKDMCDYYNVKFTPIPHYMVDECDITAYNRKGEKIVVKNQSAYYKAAECNRTEKDEFYNMLGTCADLNGDVGQQWLALYYAKNRYAEPIIASSLTAVKGSEQIPSGYNTGIHMFGSDSAFNLNSSLYDWNNDAESIYVYFRTDSNTVTSSGSNFTAGTVALAGGTGLLAGAVLIALTAKTKRKNAKDNAVPA
jgi:hypothetical protein